jgi:hypothetical protein
VIDADIPAARRDLVNVSAIQYVADQHGETTGVFIPIDVWRNIQEQLAVNDPSGQPTAWDVLDSLAGSIDAPRTGRKSMTTTFTALRNANALALR